MTLKPLYRGLIVAGLHCALVLSLAAKYSYDAATLPRAWARAVPVDPNLPIRGRYVSLNLEVETDRSIADWTPVQLSAREGKLVANPIPGTTYRGWNDSVLTNRNGRAVLMQPVAFFLPEHVPDPSRRSPGEELWVEVSVPRQGPPRPVRLAVLKDGVRTPLTF